jgi:2-hydroxycyclohexanecarboxyl-CoA dehydrogenase
MNRVALVTGAGRGIGAEIARQLADDGLRVAVTDLDEQAARSTAKEMHDRHGPDSAVAVGLDVRDLGALAHALASVEASLGPVDVLVNNAGIDRIGPFTESTPQTWALLLEINLRGPIAVTHAVLPGMLRRGWGRVVSIASDAGKVGSSGEVVYSAAKGGIIAFTKALARETAAAGVTLNCVCPGPTDTALLDQVADADRRLYDSLARAVPMRRIGRPDDVAPAVTFLAGEGARYITGQALSVSGGLTMN